MAYLDIIKINHWLNARKLTINLFKVKKFNLYKKLKKIKILNVPIMKLTTY